MGKRTTIVLDGETIKALRNLQAELISRHQRGISLSSIINNLVRKQLKLPQDLV